MKYRPAIGSGDLATKTRHVRKFLEAGHKVKITVMFRGREVSHPELGTDIMAKIIDLISDVGKAESQPKLDGRNMVMLLRPLSNREKNN